MINTHPFFDFTDFQGRSNADSTSLLSTSTVLFAGQTSTRSGRVRIEVFMIHVGGTRCVTSSIDRIIQIHARITWGVEFIRAIFFIFFFYV
jgi:hypothetical protein